MDQNKVAKRKIKFGSNSLVLQELNVWHIFLRQFRSAFIYLLLGAMIITIFLNEYIDAFMISVFLTVNVGLGFFQEYRSEKTVKLLNKFTLPRTRVLRDGKIEQIVSTKLVPGDIIILETGDKIPADVRIIEQSNLMVDETILTGESVSVYKKGESLTHQPTAYHEALNLGFSGTDVLKGWAKAVVVATGKNTAFGQIAKLTVESQKISDFEKGISRFSGFIIKLVGLTLFIVLLANIFIKRDGIDILELIIFSVALTVSVIPEALPLVTTFSLARGARRLAQNKVIVKRLSAIEDLGAIEILCSDKTGTLTRNILTVANIYSDNPDQALFLANIASSFELKKKTEPFDIALEQELNSDQKKQIKKVKKIAEEPFDPKIRRNIILAKIDKRDLLITRGAPEAVIEVCEKITENNQKKINDWIIREGEQGHRVLAIAYKEERGADSDGCTEKIVQEKDFKFLGIVSFVDPIKKSSFATVKKAKGLGVRMMVITGDSPEVAGAVGYEIGLISSPDRVIRGEKWEKMKKEKQAQCLDNYSVFARVSPEQKFKIIESLRERYMVGFLGEGINDAPALKIAGVSLVVDSAADIAREAADIVLLKKNLGVILDGIEEGRQVFANTAKYIKSTLASNFGNFFAVATASLLIDFLPMLPIQILLVNLLSDTPMISISTDSVDRDELVSPKKYEVKDIIIVAIILGLISTVFDFIFFGMFYRISPGVLQTNWFIGSILTELVLIFSIRTKSLFIRGTRSSGPLIWLSIVTFVTTVGLPYTQFGQRVFRFVPPSKIHLILILSLVLIYFTCSEIVKLLYYSSKSKQKIIKTSVV
ncbi:hypothetical protein A2331_03085 [Candidatus Falkowbacteria bacterium RIFOXYB2_FULL_34_18]|uniref:Cation-transporting P-type ATPase N-terminal domain-containing protein n=1 Tax=Candidatus Falkowbacteria bacterium RIFOXYD2_FULL_34_120 TaxID=1798007 RepID=A0A1F5TP41_9BACT|nr:MAG: hypothetical protein A2331_03085 [Candidatus Falkowbacteria bacterium RIFOXYB2_FULL_34_18]OGF29006.1 MAG: hypothetical protein A2500_00440 [Candidatus Falkowbacteria bacterium RIFOXYC12_FULL_34_55]OGF36340.1 MAG: hypothetical protein A2466_06880 [Candidatus Falkowbacteria bacterium RIFOXYC2_FULL_34_220]OGF38808.1 MAG: hypothetical protein A2515_03530 [Candidatus Falkowbacteria bacterium RIFOXYD12_FULL_34_57]OGF40723.1 MAG: hypothetical protein A2531_01110 [Candidatus Falkowbacteria bact